MSFPKPIPLPPEVILARKARGKALTRITLLGISVRLFIVCFELGGFFVFNSSALLLDAFSTLADVLSSIFLVISIKLAERPPDEEHPFGHGRYEPLAGLQLGIFMILGGGGLFLQQFRSLFHMQVQEPLDPHVWLIPFIVVILLEISFRKMTRVAKKEKSPALAAEALHFRVDSLNSVLALTALVFASLLPHVSVLLDRLGALAIALFMAIMGLIAAKKNLNQLLDRIPEEEYFHKVKLAAQNVEGVLGTEKIRIQLSGPSAHVDIDIEVDPSLQVKDAHTISQFVRTAIQKEWPLVQDVTVHIEPFYENDHS